MGIGFWLAYVLSPRLVRRRMLQIKLDTERATDLAARSNDAVRKMLGY